MEINKLHEAEQRKSSIELGEVENHALKSGILSTTEHDEYLRLKDSFQGEQLRSLTRKIDIRVLPQLIFLYLMSYVDRSNIGNAKLFGAQPDLGMSGREWNMALSVFFITYAFGGVPANICLKRFGPKIWLPCMITAVGAVLICTSLQNNLAGWTAFRVLLGWVEAGVFPGCSFVLTSWYSPGELHSRMTIFYSGASAAGAFSGLLAYGIGQLDYQWGFRGWRFIYCIEGVFTVLLGLGGFFYIHDTPQKAGKWLTDEEKKFLVLRNKYSAGGDSGVAEEDRFSMKYAKQAFKSPHTYAIATIEFTVAVVVYGISFVLPTIISNLGYSNATSQALTAPPYVFACLVTIFSGWAADRYRQRMLSVVLPNIMAACGFLIIVASVRYEHLTGVTLLGLFLMAGGLYPVSPAVMAWSALNMSGSMKRAVGMALMISFSQLGGIVGSNIYISSQSPTYSIGFGISLGMLVVFGIIWPVVYFFWLKKVNRRRSEMSLDDVLARYTEEELVEMGDESPLFRYAT